MRLVDIFEKEAECDYRNEHYSVRDNGAVMRFPKENKKRRSIDGVWTFGSLDIVNGYRLIGGERVHRIVATAFLGPAPTTKHVVDHIDTNKQNNRPENLRWVTRLENIILNPITRKRIEDLCGRPIEEVLDNMSILHSINIPNSFAWMHTVTKEESLATLKRFNNWVEKGQVAERGNKRGINYSAYIRDFYKLDTKKFLLEPDGEEPSLDLYEKALKRNRVFWCLEYLSGYTKTHSLIDRYYDEELRVIYVACKAIGDVYPFYLWTIRVEKESLLNKDTYHYQYKGFVSIADLDEYMSLAKEKEFDDEEMEEEPTARANSEPKETTVSSAAIAEPHYHQTPYYMLEPTGDDVSIEAYAEKLKEGAVFYRKDNDYNTFTEVVLESFLDKASGRLFVVTMNLHGKKKKLTIIKLGDFGFIYFNKKFNIDEQLESYLSMIKKELKIK